MKKLILLLTICILTSCINSTSTPLVVTKIRICSECSYSEFVVTINEEIDIYTNINYNIGDTLNSNLFNVYLFNNNIAWQ